MRRALAYRRTLESVSRKSPKGNRKGLRGSGSGASGGSHASRQQSSARSRIVPPSAPAEAVTRSRHPRGTTTHGRRTTRARTRMRRATRDHHTHTHVPHDVLPPTARAAAGAPHTRPTPHQRTIPEARVLESRVMDPENGRRKEIEHSKRHLAGECCCCCYLYCCCSSSCCRLRQPLAHSVIRFSILSEGHRASQDFPFCPKDTEQVKRLCQSTERYERQRRNLTHTRNAAERQRI